MPPWDMAPPPDTAFEKGSHGTHVMDIAAGNGLGTKVPGMAPHADIVFVEVSASDIPWDGPDAVGKSFGDSVQLLEAVRYIFDVAGNRPCVINASLGTNGGPHDGTSLVEQGIDRLLTQATNRAMVIAASNSYSDGIHASGSVQAGRSFDLMWDVPTNDATNNELEIWYAGNDRIGVEIIAPDGTSLLRVDPGQTKSLSSNGRVVLLAVNRLKDPNNDDNMIGLFSNENCRWVHGRFACTVSAFRKDRFMPGSSETMKVNHHLAPLRTTPTRWAPFLADAIPSSSVHMTRIRARPRYRIFRAGDPHVTDARSPRYPLRVMMSWQRTLVRKPV